MIDRDGWVERQSKESVLSVPLNDDDDDDDEDDDDEDDDDDDEDGSVGSEH